MKRILHVNDLHDDVLADIWCLLDASERQIVVPMVCKRWRDASRASTAAKGRVPDDLGADRFGMGYCLARTAVAAAAQHAPAKPHDHVRAALNAEHELRLFRLLDGCFVCPHIRHTCVTS